MIAIVDFGMGNLGSVKNMLSKLGAEATITADAAEIRRAEKIILPGVGALDRGMRNLEELGLTGVLNERVHEDRVPVLGICLGMQLLTRGSEEGCRPGLGWIEADTVRLGGPDLAEAGLRIPQMGWNTLNVERPHPLVEALGVEPRFYFVHSYWVRCADSNDVVATTRYGYDFTSIIARENVFGTQFHPEKSHNFGMALLRNFMALG